MTKHHRRRARAHLGKINTLSQLLERMSKHLLIRTNNHAAAPAYSCGEFVVKPNLVNNAIAAKLIVVRDPGLFGGDAAQSYERRADNF